MKKPILAFLVGIGSIYSVQAQDSTTVESSETTPPTEEVAEEEIATEEDLFAMDFEDLLGMEVTSVSKKAERLQDVAASIYVVTSDDIAKSGATNLHEVLRTVPGYWGVQDSYNSVASSIRNSPSQDGSTGTVLYLLDGTPIQDNMTSTFVFSNFDIPLDEIDRIEVIRGSGGSVYGANSATGVVNIFTKDPSKYDGINARIEGATSSYMAASIRAGGKVTEQLSVSGYGKFRHFGGYGSLSDKDANGDFINYDSRFTKDYDVQDMMSFGLKAKYKLNEKSKLSLNTHLNTLSKTRYSNSYEGDHTLLGPVLGQKYDDVLYENNLNSNRLVGNLRYDYEFNDDHSLFVRASTNTENSFYGIGGGYKVSNAIYDFEIQDNISIGSMNDLSVGANYRIVKFDVHDINSEQSINYVDPQNSEAITGAFIQDKIKFLDGKLNLLVGLKAENYSLINSEYYLSPMAKLSFIPIENLTLWGGFTQSYTTPGYNNTNVDFMLYQAPSAEDYTSVATSKVYQDQYDLAVAGGADDAAAKAAAEAFLASPAGAPTVAGTAAGIEAGTPASAKTSVGVKNGSNTVPTQFQTWEIGFRASAENRVSFESNFFYTTVKDGIGVAQGNPVFENSPTDPSRSAAYYYYGNYVEGTNIGTETMFKIKSSDGITFEFAHTWLESTWKSQKNDDFDIDDLTDEERDQTPDVPQIPKHTFRVKGYFDLPAKLNLSVGLIYATRFNTEANYKFSGERYENLATSDGDAVIAPNSERTIVNLRLEKLLLEDKLSVYVFGNDVFNEGLIASTNRVSNVTLSQIKGMYGLGANYKF